MNIFYKIHPLLCDLSAISTSDQETTAVFASNFFCVMNSKYMHLNHVNWYCKHRDENVQVSIAVLAQACINILTFSEKMAG